MTGHIKVGGVWKEMAAASVKVGGVWKEVTNGYTKIGGAWKEWFAATSPAFDLLETTVLSSNASTVNFTGLGAYADYKHLQVRVRLQSTFGSNLFVRLNNIDTTVYSRHAIYTDGSGIYAYNQTGESLINFDGLINGSSQPNYWNGYIIDIADFSSTNKNTTLKAISGEPDWNQQMFLRSGLIDDTSAVTEINFINSSGFFKPNSRFSLYGVK